MSLPMALAAFALGLVFARPPPAAEAFEAAVTVDANLVTALDVSDSIMRHEEWIEFDGIARAVVHPDLLAAVLAGRHGRIGFAVYTWAGGGRFRIVVPWTTIGSAEDAERVAGLLRRTPRIDRSHYRDSVGRSDAPMPAGRRTDVSAAIGFGLDMLKAAPRQAARSVLNICGNGADNVGHGPGRIRDAAVASGVTINGLVVGYKRGVAGYYREHVAGGAGSFVLRVTDPADMADALVSKFLMDLIAGSDGAAAAS